MSATTTEIAGTFIRERFRFSNERGDVVIGTIECGDMLEDVTIKGPADVDELTVGGSYRFMGRWTEYCNPRTKETERQFAFQTFVACEPHTEEAIVGYLQQCEGIGAATARAIHKRFGQEAVKALREQPELVAGSVKRLRLDIATKAAEWLQERADLEQTTMDVMDLLRGRYFPNATARNAIKKWGARAAEIIKEDPFQLMSLGCGFKRCDAMWVAIGLNPASMKRQALCAWWYCASDTSGSTWHSAIAVERAVVAAVGSALVDPKKAIRLACSEGLLRAKWTDGVYGAPDDDGDTMWLADAKKAASEFSIARSVEFITKKAED